MSNRTFLRVIRYALVLCFTLTSGYLFAGVNCGSGLSCTQTIELKPGWNSIFIQLDPDVQATEQLFADMLDGSGPQISSVWTWLAERAKIDFIQDPDPDNLLSQAGWLRFFPDQSKQAFMTNLYAIQANRAYLVKLEGDQNVTLSITGTAVVPRINWEPGSFNHLGFHVDPQNRPVFYDFFAASPAHNGQPAYQLVNDQWQQVDPLNTIIQPDVAYWIFSKTGSDYTGPIQVELPQLDRLEYGEALNQFTVRLNNRINVPQSISMQILGDALGMYYPNPDLAATQRWLPLPAPLTKSIEIAGKERIPLGIRRADFHLSNYNHTLEITSAGGSRWLIPVTASAPQLKSLWVGSVTINGVSQVQNYQHNCKETKVTRDYETYDDKGKEITLSYDEFEPNLATQGDPDAFDLCRDDNGFPVAKAEGNTVTPVKEGSEFSFRVILYDDGSQVKLLKDVIQMWEKDSVDGAGNTVPGGYVLLTDDSQLGNYDGITLRDGEIVGRRVSSIAYDFSPEPKFPDDLNLLHDPNNPDDVHDPNDPNDVHDPSDSNNLRYPIERTYTHNMTGTLDSQMQTRLVLAANAPSNPFRHHYHNDHKDLGFAITRNMTFDAVAPAATSGVSALGVGREVIQGSYREVIEGLHKLPIIVEGSYTLRHAVSVDKFINK